jgi:hypothetical protein
LADLRNEGFFMDMKQKKILKIKSKIARGGGRKEKN